MVAHFKIVSLLINSEFPVIKGKTVPSPGQVKNNNAPIPSPVAVVPTPDFPREICATEALLFKTSETPSLAEFVMRAWL